MHYMFPDPVFVPKETLRTFYVDPNWFKTFFDGALSVTEHFTDQDEVRFMSAQLKSMCDNQSHCD